MQCNVGQLFGYQMDKNFIVDGTNITINQLNLYSAKKS